MSLAQHDNVIYDESIKPNGIKLLRLLEDQKQQLQALALNCPLGGWKVLLV